MNFCVHHSMTIRFLTRFGLEKSWNRLRLIDFNISKKWKNRGDEDKFNATFLTQVSTPIYASPEVYSKAGYNESIDIWGIGMIAYVLIGGIADVNIKKLASTDEKIELSYLSFIEASEMIPDYLKGFLAKCLSINPADRPCVEDSDFDEVITNGIS